MTDEETAADLERAAAFDKIFTPKMRGHLVRAAHVLRTAPQMEKALEELVVIVEGIRTEGDAPDSFTCQPARIALAAYRGGK